MKWYEVELEMPIFGKNYEIVEATDIDFAKAIALRKTQTNYNVRKEEIFITNVKEIIHKI